MKQNDIHPKQQIEIPYRYKVERIEKEFVFCRGLDYGSEIRLRLDQLEQVRLVSDPATGWDEERLPGKRSI